MEKELKEGEKIYVRVEKKYRDEPIIYKIGRVKKIYPNYVLIEFNFGSGNSYQEGYNITTLRYKKELGENDCVYKKSR